jgi:hypothetical protein
MFVNGGSKGFSASGLTPQGMRLNRAKGQGSGTLQEHLDCPENLRNAGGSSVDDSGFSVRSKDNDRLECRETGESWFFA